MINKHGRIHLAIWDDFERGKVLISCPHEMNHVRKLIDYLHISCKIVLSPRQIVEPIHNLKNTYVPQYRMLPCVNLSNINKGPRSSPIQSQPTLPAPVLYFSSCKFYVPRYESPTRCRAKHLLRPFSYQLSRRLRPRRNS